MTKNINLLKNYGSVITINNSDDDNIIKNIKIFQIPLLICMIIISFVSLCCALFICISNSKKYLKIFYLCGARHYQNLIICLNTSIFIIVFSNLPYAFFLPLALKYNLFNWTYSFIAKGLIIMLVLDLIIFILAFIVSQLVLIKMKKGYGLFRGAKND